MGKIVAIVSSPRVKGNSNAIVDAITDGAMGLSTNIIKLHRLDRIKVLHGCKGCMNCKVKGFCIQDDEISDIITDIKSAQHIIISTPVYFDGACSQFKTFLDRMFSLLGTDGSTTLPEGITLTLVVTCSGPEEVAQYVAKKISTIMTTLGFKQQNIITYSDRAGTRHAKDDDEIMKRAKDLGRTFRNT